jgi:predicted MFS family arabinose efflux permease
LARKRSQRSLIQAGFALTLVGMLLLLFLYKLTSGIWVFAPGLLMMGLGIGLMLTPSVNVVQSAFPEEKQGEISGLSRAVSNLGSSMGTAIAGTIVVADAAAGNSSYGAAMIVLCGFGLIGLVVSILIPRVPG